eukprot:2613074-Rhodomonas_salina.3
MTSISAQRNSVEQQREKAIETRQRFQCRLYDARRVLRLILPAGSRRRQAARSLRTTLPSFLRPAPAHT